TPEAQGGGSMRPFVTFTAQTCAICATRYKAPRDPHRSRASISPEAAQGLVWIAPQTTGSGVRRKRREAEACGRLLHSGGNVLAWRFGTIVPSPTIGSGGSESRPPQPLLAGIFLIGGRQS